MMRGGGDNMMGMDMMGGGYGPPMGGGYGPPMGGYGPPMGGYLLPPRF